MLLVELDLKVLNLLLHLDHLVLDNVRGLLNDLIYVHVRLYLDGFLAEVNRTYAFTVI